MSVLPTKLLTARIISLQDESYWTEDDGTGDPWIGMPYRWTATMNVDVAAHSSHVTTTPFYYTVDDIKVGDWVSSAPGGNALQIVEIISVDGSNIVVVCEDVDRFNTFTDPYQSGNGSIPNGSAFIFELNEEGTPLLTGVPSGVLPPAFQIDLVGRFEARNAYRDFVRVNQPEHGMSVGDLIRPDPQNPGHYIKALADAHISDVLGVVKEINTPGLEWFTFRPFGKVINNVTPPLVGNFGDYFYVDPVNPGKLTNIKPSNNARAIYMRLDRPDRGLLVELGVQDYNETQKFDVEVTDGQTVFTLPANAEVVLYMSINGIENKDFIFDENSKVLTFDPVATGYGVETTDEVFFIYKS